MQRHIKIAVLGGGGRTGNYLVRLLAQKGYAMKLLLRHPEKFSLENPLIEMVKGNALDTKIIAELLKMHR